VVTLAPFLLVWLFPLVPLVPGAQDDEPAKVTLARHDRCTMNERLLAFLDAWALADERARAGAAELLLAARPRGAAAAARPDLSLLVDFARESATGVAVAGPFDLTTEERRAQVQALADQIDLVVTPGAFGARDESAADKGEPTTVHVRLFGSPRSHADVDLGLVWIGPDGRQVVARREPVSVSVLRDGVPMYVRPPASRPGPWRLVPELARKGAIARGVPVPVECVARVAARVAALEASASEEEGGTDSTSPR
jgi:hypothetical protein